MRKLKYKANCQHCGKPAVWRSNGITKNLRMCEEHKALIQEAEKKYRDDGHISEGDYQSWGRL